MRKYLAKQYTTKANYPSTNENKDSDVRNIIHCIYGFLVQEKPFEYYKYIAIMSAKNVNKPDKIYFHYKYEPYGEYWDKVKHLLEMKKVEPPQQYMNIFIKHYAHQADILRLQILYQYGGVYLDIDTICLKPFHDLFKFNITLGYQSTHGLCNAVIISKPKNIFIKDWLNNYKTFRSEGKDIYYDEHSVILPMKMALQRSDVNIMEHNAFFYPLAENIVNVLFEDHTSMNMAEKDYINRNCYCIHLWESMTYDQIKTIENKKSSLYYFYSQKFEN